MPHALVVQNKTSGIRSSFAASRVKLMTPSETMHDTVGVGEEGSLSFVIRSRKGGRQFFGMESQREGMSWVASSSVGGRPSGMDSKRKFGRLSREEMAPDLRRRLWLKWVLTKVM